MKRIEKDVFIQKLRQVKSAKSVSRGIVYSSIRLEGNTCKGIRESTKKPFKIYVDELYQAYCELDAINTKKMKPYISTRAQSPAWAILVEMGLADDKRIL